MMLGPVARLIVGALLAFAVLHCVMSVRALIEADSLHDEAQRSLERGHIDDAITALRLSARWQGPLNAHASPAFEALEHLAQAAEARGETERALSAYRAIHASAMASRGFYVPEQERVARADVRMFALLNATPSGGSSDMDDASIPQKRAAYLAALVPQRPHLLGVLASWFGLASWVIGTSVFLLRGLDAQGRLVHRIAKRSALFVSVGWLVFAFGLRVA